MTDAPRSDALLSMASSDLALVVAAAIAAGPTGLARDLAPGELLKPLGDAGPSYSGDYTGKRYSPSRR